VVAHRWIGLTTAVFLVIVGLTGSLLAYYEPLDRMLAPELLTVPVRDAPMLDPFTLRDRAIQLEPRGDVDGVDLDPTAGRSFQALVTPRNDPQTGEPFELPYDVLFIDPYTGARLGERHWGVLSLERKALMPFAYKLHYALAMPDRMVMFGIYLLGVVALAWTIDCFIALYLTLPTTRRGAVPRRNWFVRYRPAWLPKWHAGPFRLLYDLHRAFGLWTWAMLFVLAWSSVALNLTDVYDPVTRALLGPMTPLHAERPVAGPIIDWRDAYARGRELMQDAARTNGFAVVKESQMYLDPDHRAYHYVVHGTADTSANGYTMVMFDATNGALERVEWAGSETAADVVTNWLISLHTARVFGAPMHAFVCVMGFVVAGLAGSGVYVWWVKRRHRSRMRAPPLSSKSGP
jgi:uncharacterized iron-regulated membrane protein